MKLENFSKAQQLHNEMKAIADKLKELETKGIEVQINYSSGARLFTIGTDVTCEHQFTKEASNFIELIKSELREEYDRLKNQFELL